MLTMLTLLQVDISFWSLSAPSQSLSVPTSLVAPWNVHRYHLAPLAASRQTFERMSMKLFVTYLATLSDDPISRCTPTEEESFGI